MRFLYIKIYIVFVVISEVISLIVFPIKYIEEAEADGVTHYEFGWGYGVGWGATIFMLGSGILLWCDRNGEEVLYREKTCYYNDEEAGEEDATG
jgi:hypothetical protein